MLLLERYANIKVNANSAKNSKQLEVLTKLNMEAKYIWANAMEKLGLSAKAYDRIKKVSRTIVDL